MNIETDADRMPERLRKLHALANHPNTPPAEAEVARAMLRKLAAEQGLTEEALGDDAVLVWRLTIRAGLEELLQAVINMITDGYVVARTLVFWEVARGKLAASVRCAAMDWGDIRACFGYYSAVYDRTAGKISDQIRPLMVKVKVGGWDAPEAKREVAALRKARANLPGQMVFKYSIYAPSSLAQWKKNDEEWTREFNAKWDKLTPEERDKLAGGGPRTERQKEDSRARMKAREALTADAWSKPEAELGVTKEIGAGARLLA